MPFAPIKDGQLYFEEHGKGPPLLLVAGLGGVGSYWKPQLEEFSRHYRVIIHDHRGTGQSTDVLALMDHLKLERAHLVGHSTGGAIGQTLGITAPHRIDSMVLYASWTKTDAFMGRVMRARKALLQNGVDDYIELSPALLYPDWWLNNNPDKLAALDAATRAGFPGASIAASRCQAVIDFDRTGELHRIDRPTRVLCARDDFLTPLYFSEELARKIPGATLTVLEKGGHAVSQVDPAAFNVAVLDFLGTVPAAASSS
jgi:aminoacrylate hydrolase